MTGSEVVQRINKLLKEKKISKQQFYNDCGISSAAYSQWNTGKTFPTRANLLTISEYLETTDEYLLTGEGQKNSPTPEGAELKKLTPDRYDEFLSELSMEELILLNAKLANHMNRISGGAKE